MTIKRILIAGATGFIGSALAKRLKELNYSVSVLSRRRNVTSNYETFYWNVAEGIIQENALNNVDYIINLAGENISSGRWTEKRKALIEESRVRSAELIFNEIIKHEQKPELYVSASATGFYGTINSEHIFNESDSSGSDFLAKVCHNWELSATQFQSLGIRSCILRTGVVFDKNMGAFPKLTQTLKFGFISSVGSGKQYIPWIHISDLMKMYLFAIENPHINGIYNAVAPCHLNMYSLVKEIRNISDKRFPAPAVPELVLKVMFGEMASVLLSGSRVSADKILGSGFEFEYPEIVSALKTLL